MSDAWLGLAVAASLAGAFGLGPWGLALPAFGGAGLIVAFGVVLGARGMLPLPGALRVHVHEHGFVVFRRSGRSTELRYREVVSLVSSTVSGREDVMRTHVVRDAHGREVVLTHQIERCSELADTIRKRSWPSRLAAPQAAIDRGESVAFGRASLSSSAIIVEGKRPLAFAEVDDVTAADDVVRITRRDPTLRDPVVWTRLAYGDVADADVFIELARARIAAAR